MSVNSGISGIFQEKNNDNHRTDFLRGTQQNSNGLVIIDRDIRFRQTGNSQHRVQRHAISKHGSGNA